MKLSEKSWLKSQAQRDLRLQTRESWQKAWLRKVLVEKPGTTGSALADSGVLAEAWLRKVLVEKLGTTRSALVWPDSGVLAKGQAQKVLAKGQARKVPIFLTGIEKTWLKGVRQKLSSDGTS